MNGFERRKEQTRESIRRAALELFKVHGMKKVTISEIAGRANVSPVTIYNHFDSKEDLVRDVVKSLIQSSSEEIESLLESEGSFKERMERVMFRKTDMIRDWGGELLQAVCSADPEFREFMDSSYRQAKEVFAGLLVKGQEEGYVNPEVSGDMLLEYLEMFRQFVLTRYPSSAEGDRYMKHGRELSSLFFYGLSGNTGHAMPLVGVENETRR